MKNNPIAYEWHNLETGHCYVDYAPKHFEIDGVWTKLDETNGYTKTPLFKESHSKESFRLSDEEIRKNCPQSIEPRIGCWIRGAEWYRDQVQINLRDAFNAGNLICYHQEVHGHECNCPEWIKGSDNEDAFIRYLNKKQ